MEKMNKIVREMIKKEPLSSANLKLLGIGSEKMVFETPGSSRKIIKVNIDFIRAKISALLKKEFNKIDINDEVDDYQKRLIEDHRQVESEVSEFFGKEHVLRNGVFRVKIPITNEMIQKLFSNDQNILSFVNKLDANKVYEIETLAETQIVAEELKDSKTYHTRNVKTALITADDFYGSEDIPTALEKARNLVNKLILSGFDEVSKDKKYIEIVKEITTKMIQYTKYTGHMLDIFGPDNITIFSKDGISFNYHLVDIAFPGFQKYWRKKISEDKNYSLLRHNYVYYYTLKAIGDKLQIKENLESEDLNYFKGFGIPKEGKFPIKK